jgi:hypothetical protein
MTVASPMPELRRRHPQMVGVRRIPRPIIRMLVADATIVLTVTGPLAPDGVPLVMREIELAAGVCHGEVVVDVTKAQVADADLRLLERLTTERVQIAQCSLRWEK